MVSLCRIVIEASMGDVRCCLTAHPISSFDLILT